MRKHLLLSLALLGAAAAPALALNPQPLPPFQLRAHDTVVLADGSTATVLGDGKHVSTMQNGKMVVLPPGQLKLKNGSTLLIAPGGAIVRSIGSQSSGAGAGKINGDDKTIHMNKTGQ